MNVACISTRTQNKRNQQSTFTGKPEVQVSTFIPSSHNIIHVLKIAVSEYCSWLHNSNLIASLFA